MLATLARHRALCPEVEQHFALCFEGRLSDELRSLDVPLYMLGAVRLRRPLSVWRARRALRLALEQSGCDVVVCHGPWTMVTFAPAVRAARLPLVRWVHGVKAGQHWLEWLTRHVPPDLAICNSRFTQRALASLHPSLNSAVINNPVEMPNPHRNEAQRARVREELGAPADAVVIVQASRMVALKGHRLLIDALADLRGESSWRCWILGGPQRDSEESYLRDLEERVREAGLSDRVRFIGQRRDVPRVLAAADIYCQPNQGPDAFGAVFVEAMLAGLPVVTTAIGGAIEVVDQGSGVLVPANDRAALARVLREMVTDPTIRQRTSAGGAARARGLSEPGARLHDLRRALDSLVSSSRQ